MVISRAEYIAKKNTEELVKKLASRDKHLQRCWENIARKCLYLNGLPDDDELISFLRDELAKEGWGVTVSKKEVRGRKRKPPYTENEKSHTTISLSFGDLPPARADYTPLGFSVIDVVEEDIYPPIGDDRGFSWDKISY